METFYFDSITFESHGRTLVLCLKSYIDSNYIVGGGFLRKNKHFKSRCGGISFSVCRFLFLSRPSAVLFPFLLLLPCLIFTFL